MELQYERFLRDDELRARLEHDAHRARAVAVQEFLARSAQALFARRPETGDPCRSSASR
jgi:hypothetical protein